MKIQATLRCKKGSPPCLNEFTIRLDAKYAGMKVQVECPKCRSKLIIDIPASAGGNNGVPTLDQVLDSIEERAKALAETFRSPEVSAIFEYIFGSEDEPRPFS